MRFVDALTIIDPELLETPNGRQAAHILKRPRTWKLLPVKESYGSLKEFFDTIIRSQIKELESSSIATSTGVSFQARVRLFLADNKATQAVLGLNNGLYPCPLCYCPRRRFSEYAAGKLHPVRSIKTIFNRAMGNGEQDTPVGDISKPLFCEEDGSCCDLSVGVDTLHLVENVGLSVLKHVFGTVGESESKLRTQLKERFNKSTPIQVAFVKGKAEISGTARAIRADRLS